jgi:hypothetical protein
MLYIHTIYVCYTYTKAGIRGGEPSKTTLAGGEPDDTTPHRSQVVEEGGGGHALGGGGGEVGTVPAVIRIINGFAYTGGSTIAAARAAAEGLGVQVKKKKIKNKKM